MTSEAQAEAAGLVALVTGCGNPDGLGAAFARKLAECGARLVVVSATTQERAAAAASAISEAAGVAPDAIVGVSADLSDSKQAWELVDRTQYLGAGVIDVVVNNAGTGVIPPRMMEAMASREEVDSVLNHVFAVNVYGPMHIVRAATPYLKKSKNGGRIINISSVAAERPVPTMGFYAASKAALDSLTKTLAVELAPHKITVNSILPGPFETVMYKHIPVDERAKLLQGVPLGRLGVPYEDLAGVVSFLVSSSAAYTTGAMIKVAGGMWI